MGKASGKLPWYTSNLYLVSQIIFGHTLQVLIFLLYEMVIDWNFVLLSFIVSNLRSRLFRCISVFCQAIFYCISKVVAIFISLLLILKCLSSLTPFFSEWPWFRGVFASVELTLNKQLADFYLCESIKYHSLLKSTSYYVFENR